MPAIDTHQQILARRLARILVAFFLIATLFLLVVYFAAPSIYTDTLMLRSPPSDRYPLPATLFLVGIVVFITILIASVLRKWRWLFWLLLGAFGFMILEVPRQFCNWQVFSLTLTRCGIVFAGWASPL